VTAITAGQVLKDQSSNAVNIKGRLVYNANPTGNQPGSDPAAFDPDAILYVLDEDLTPQKTLRPDVVVEPLILRVRAGDWVRVNLTNAVDPAAHTFNVNTDQSKVAEGVNSTPWADKPLKDNLARFRTPPQAGLQPQLVSYDAGRSSGVNVGFNPDQTVEPGKTRALYWYAGLLTVGSGGALDQRPVEFGAANLIPADMLTQHQKGLYGALVVEPEGSSWVEDRLTRQVTVNDQEVMGSLRTRATATVRKPDGTVFREAVLVFQNDVANSSLIAKGAVNYLSEPLAARALDISGSATSNTAGALAPSPLGNARFFSDSQQSNGADPQTPIVFARAGQEVRLRVLFPGGTSYQQGKVPPIFNVEGHVWQEEPYVRGGRAIGNNQLSNRRGMQEFAPYQALNVVLPSAGGAHKVPGDYLYSTFQAEYTFGTWGILRVSP
jgi:hypothetical protein